MSIGPLSHLSGGLPLRRRQKRSAADLARRAGVTLAVLFTGTACRETRQPPAPPPSTAPAPEPVPTPPSTSTSTTTSVPTVIVVLDPETTTTLVTLPPETTTTTEAPPDLFAVGRSALSFGIDEPRVNPDTGTANWNHYCLGWVHNALKSQGVDPWELQAGTAVKAYRRAHDAGKLQYGNPPAGAIVFFPEMSSLGHVGLSNGDGTYRGTMPPQENPRTLGDRPIKNLDSVPWMAPTS